MGRPYVLFGVSVGRAACADLEPRGVCVVGVPAPVVERSGDEAGGVCDCELGRRWVRGGYFLQKARRIPYSPKLEEAQSSDEASEEFDDDLFIAAV